MGKFSDFHDFQDFFENFYFSKNFIFIGYLENWCGGGSTSPPGGNQVDGLPPASSTDAAGS